jgi:hypothetical protein
VLACPGAGRLRAHLSPPLTLVVTWAVVNLPTGQPSNPWALMGHRGIFSPYQFLVVGAFGPFIAGRVPRRVEPECGMSTRSNGAGQRNATNAAIMVVVGVEALFRLSFPSLIIGVLSPSAVTAPFRLPVLIVSLLPKPKPFPIYTPALTRAPNPVSPPNNGVMVSLGRGLGASRRSYRRLLCPQSAVGECLLPGREEVPTSRDGYIVSFTHFHERGFGMPPHPFFRGLLHHY